MNWGLRPSLRLSVITNLNSLCLPLGRALNRAAQPRGLIAPLCIGVAAVRTGASELEELLSQRGGNRRENPRFAHEPLV